VSLSREQSLTILHASQNASASSDYNIINVIIENIQQKILSFEPNGAFIRLSSLSPKDAALKNEQRIAALLQEELLSLPDLTNAPAIERALTSCIGKTLRGKKNKKKT
jgi:hypothetical protein